MLSPFFRKDGARHWRGSAEGEACCKEGVPSQALEDGYASALREGFIREALEQKQVIFKEALCALGFEPKKEDPIL